NQHYNNLNKLISLNKMAFNENLNEKFIEDFEHALNIQEKINDKKIESKLKSEVETQTASKSLFESCELHLLYPDDSLDDEFILNLFKYFFKIFNTHYEPVYVVNLLRQYFKDNNKNPLDIFNQLIHHRNQNYFTSMIGYFYQFGIGTD
ncbi:30766_t:CDS:2, partial [Racocetra persica]